MTISSETRKAGPYNCNGVTTNFAFTFKVFAADEVLVKRTTSLGVESTLVKDTDYTVSLNADQNNNPGGSITTIGASSPYATGNKITLTSDVEETQETDITNGGGFFPQVIENALDKLVILLQQLSGFVTRSIKIPISDSTGTALELPTAALRANKALIFDVDGNVDVGTLDGVLTFSPTTQTFSGDGSETDFTLAHDPGSASALIVAISGVVQVPGDDYNVSGTTLTFTAAPVSGTDNIRVTNFGAALGVNADVAADAVEYTPNGSGAVVTDVQTKLREIKSVGDFGGAGDGSTDDTTAADALFDLTSPALKHIAGAHNIADISLAADQRFIGDGHFIGDTVVGSKPDTTALRATNTAGRLSLLETYYPTVITLTANITIRGNLELRDCLIKSASGHTLTVEGQLTLSNVSFHRVGLVSRRNGHVYATGLINSDSPGVGLYCESGGVIVAPSALVVSAGNRGVQINYGGTIDVTSGQIRDSVSHGIFILMGGTVVATSATVSDNGGSGVTINYGGTVDVSSGAVSDNTTTGITCESNGAVYAQSATIDGNGTVGIFTHYGGFVQASSATITNSGTYAAYAQGGTLWLDDATVDTTNTGAGGQIVRAIGNGFIYAEEPGVGTGKTTLSASHYYPGYNTTGNGIGFVGITAQNDAVISLGGAKLNAGSKTIAAGVISAVSSFLTLVDTEGAAASDDLDTITHGTSDMILLRQASDTRDVTVKHNTGNILLAGAADKVNLNRNGLVLLVWNSATSKWVEPGYT